MTSEKPSRVSRKEPRQLKELRSLLPWGWDARAVAHPPGKKTLRDFQDCRKFLDPTATDGRGSIGSSRAYRKRQKKDGKENYVVNQGSTPLPVTCTQREGAQAIDGSLGPNRELQTPLVVHKISIQKSDAPASLDDNPCTGCTLITPLDQHSNGQRLAINTLGSSISTGLAFTPGLHATPITEEAPRPAGRSESPVVPKKLVGGDSPGIFDLPDTVMHLDGQPSAEGALSSQEDGDAPPRAEAGNKQAEPCGSDASAQLTCHQLEAETVELCSGWQVENSTPMVTSPQAAQAEPGVLEQREDAAQVDTTPSAVQQLILAPTPGCQQSTAPASLPIQPLTWTEPTVTTAVLVIPCLDTTRIAKVSPGAAVLRPRTAQEGSRTCPPLFRPLEEAVPISQGSQKKPEMTVPTTVLRAAHAERVAQQDLEPADKTAPEAHAITDLAVAPYKEAIGDLWREKWGWRRPIPRTAEAKNPHHRTCRLEARFLEGCRNLMRLQCDGDRSWHGLDRQQ